MAVDFPKGYPMAESFRLICRQVNALGQEVSGGACRDAMDTNLLEYSLLNMAGIETHPVGVCFAQFVATSRQHLFKLFANGLTDRQMRRFVDSLNEKFGERTVDRAVIPPNYEGSYDACFHINIQTTIEKILPFMSNAFGIMKQTNESWLKGYSNFLLGRADYGGNGCVHAWNNAWARYQEQDIEISQSSFARPTIDVNDTDAGQGPQADLSREMPISPGQTSTASGRSSKSVSFSPDTSFATREYSGSPAKSGRS